LVSPELTRVPGTTDMHNTTDGPFRGVFYFRSAPSYKRTRKICYKFYQRTQLCTLYERAFIGVLLCLTEIKLNYLKIINIRSRSCLLSLKQKVHAHVHGRSTVNIHISLFNSVKHYKFVIVVVHYSTITFTFFTVWNIFNMFTHKNVGIANILNLIFSHPVILISILKIILSYRLYLKQATGLQNENCTLMSSIPYESYMFRWRHYSWNASLSIPATTTWRPHVLGGRNSLHIRRVARHITWICEFLTITCRQMKSFLQERLTLKSKFAHNK
jgi:hypothetical protein